MRFLHRNRRHWPSFPLISLIFATSGVALGAPGFRQNHTRAIPGATWSRQTAAQAGMDAEKLNTFRDYLGGRGCVVRHGHMVYTWGDQSVRQDVASACKPVIAHFLFRALEDGRIAGLDEPVVTWEPCLRDLNPDLQFKDRRMTFRHLATQTSCYGVSENPGQAFDYNDWQMALFWDTLFLKVYEAGYENVDQKTLHPLLMDVLQCEDNPTFLAFGKGDRPGRLRISVRDFARFGLLYLNHGNWKGRQLLSQEHAILAVTSPLPNSIPRTAADPADMCAHQRSLGSRQLPDDQTDHRGSYSYLWWTNGVDRDGKRHWPDAPLDTFAALGHRNGQRALVVIPSLDLVVSWNDTTLGNKPAGTLNEALKLLANAVVPGQIVVDPAHPAWFKYAGGGPFYMCGPGDPEDFLYRGTRNPDGTRNGDQMALISKMTGTGANCIYLQAIRSHGGDGDATHNPYVNSDLSQGLDQDILNQWETWFTAMDDNGIVIFLFFYDDDSRPFGKDLPAGGRLSARETAFIDEMVTRFKHHKHLIWCVAEEYAEGLTAAHASKIAERIRRQDNHNHPVAIHQNNGTSFDFNGDPNFDQFAVQLNEDTAAELHAGTVAAWNNVKGLKNINLAEFADSNFTKTFSGTGAELRKKLWSIAMGGGYSMVLGMDIVTTPVSDLEDCGRLVRFMEATRCNETSPHDELARGDTDYVLADPGQVYLAYGDEVDKMGLTIRPGRYHTKWYDAQKGHWVDVGLTEVTANEQVFTRPEGIGREAALYLESVAPAPDDKPSR